MIFLLKGSEIMPLQYKIDVINALKSKGYNTNLIRQKGLLSESTLTRLRKGEAISWNNLQTICELLDCQPGDIIEYVED